MILNSVTLFGGQEDSILHSFNADRVSIQETGMQVLGAWALTNIIVGGIASSKSVGETQSFWQMNAGWNLVNAGIAGFGYFTQTMPSTLSGTIAEQHSIETLLAVNAGLDIAYMLGGLYLIEKSKSAESPERLRGFGRSIIMQGAFLFAFDTILYAFNVQHGKELQTLISTLSFMPNGIGMNFQF